VLPRLSDGTYDMVFCDADARDYADYLTAALRLLRPGGIVAFNNALLAGPPEDAGGEDADGEERSGDPSLDLVSAVRANDRLIPVLLPLGDGLLAAVKRGD
jgi:predicted O-methyltransferase YrrM